jgi:hypothetical protein
MPKVGRVELRICQIEGFLVSIQNPDRRDLRSDRQGLPSWPYERAAKDSWTVDRWKRERFKAVYPGFEVDVLDADHIPVRGQSRLGNVRDTYDE